MCFCLAYLLTHILMCVFYKTYKCPSSLARILSQPQCAGTPPCCNLLATFVLAGHLAAMCWHLVAGTLVLAVLCWQRCAGRVVLAPLCWHPLLLAPCYCILPQGPSPSLPPPKADQKPSCAGTATLRFVNSHATLHVNSTLQHIFCHSHSALMLVYPI